MRPEKRREGKKKGNVRPSTPITFLHIASSLIFTMSVIKKKTGPFLLSLSSAPNKSDLKRAEYLSHTYTIKNNSNLEKGKKTDIKTY